MIDLRDAIASIKGLLADGSARALTYAALECRLSIERICYDRLAQAHDYLAVEEVRRWQPHHVIRLIEEDVDPEVASTYTISIGREPLKGGEDVTALDYVPIGTQQGFDGAVLAKLWNGLSNVALHVALPKSKTALVEQFGDPAAMRAKVEQCLAELERIATGSLTTTGFGPEVSFTCGCGTRNKRKSERLHAGKVIHCVNPECEHSFEIELDGDAFNFVVRWVHVDCTCGKSLRFARAPLERLRVNQTANSFCECGAESVFHWRLYHGLRTAADVAD
jgi:hypothetical protein